MNLYIYMSYTPKIFWYIYTSQCSKKNLKIILIHPNILKYAKIFAQPVPQNSTFHIQMKQFKTIRPHRTHSTYYPQRAHTQNWGIIIILILKCKPNVHNTQFYANEFSRFAENTFSMSHIFSSVRIVRFSTTKYKTKNASSAGAPRLKNSKSPQQIK